MQGTVDGIWRNERLNGSEYWVVSVDGQRYSVWDKKLVQNIQTGDQVEVPFTTSGRYRNLTSLEKLASTSLATAANVSAVPESRRIVRMNCLRTAAEMLKDSTLLPEQKLSLVTSIAGSPEQHVLRGARAEAAAPAPTETRHDGNGRKAREGGA